MKATVSDIIIQTQVSFLYMYLMAEAPTTMTERHAVVVMHVQDWDRVTGARVSAS